jgi:thiosulfate/3-mercaptopyruvate sulfurtransferase
MVNPTPLVTTVWLDQHLDDPNVRVVDIRGHVAPATDPLPHYFSHRADYDESHIPGAVFIDWVRDITVDGPHHMQIAPPEKFAALMSKIGVGAKTFVVAYDDAGGMFAARLWWALNYYGHPQVAVLDGGWQKWIAEDRPVTTDSPRIPVAQFEPKINPDLRRTAGDVQAALHSDTKLIDVRTEDEFRGRASRAKRSGHIPGAINLPRSQLVSPDGAMPPSGVLADMLDALEIKPSDDIILYCNGGVSASYGLLALRMAGYNGAVYDGSWKDWGNDDSKPIETLV